MANPVLHLLDRIPLSIAGLAALTLGLAPFVPEPHLFEKIGMLAQGTLTEPVDMGDLVLHGLPWLVLVAKLIRTTLAR